MDVSCHHVQYITIIKRWIQLNVMIQRNPFNPMPNWTHLVLTAEYVWRPRCILWLLVWWFFVLQDPSSHDQFGTYGPLFLRARISPPSAVSQWRNDRNCKVYLRYLRFLKQIQHVGGWQYWSNRSPCFSLQASQSMLILIVRRAGLLWSQQDFEWWWSVLLSSASLY